MQDADYNYGSDRGTMTPETVGSGKLPASGSRRFNFSGELQTMRGSVSPFRRSRTGPLFPQKNFEYQQKSDPAAMNPKLHGLGTKHFAGRYRHFNYSGELRPMRRSLSPYRYSRADALPSQDDAGHGHRLRETPIPKLWAPEGERFAGVSHHFNLSGELQTLRGSVSPYRHSRTDAFSTPKIERSQSPLAGTGILGSGREVESITNNGSKFYGEARKDRLLQASYGVERTVYVDSVNVAKNSHSNLRTSDQEVWMDPEAQGENPVKRTETEEASSGFKSSEYSNSSISRELILFSDQKCKEEEKEYLDSDSLPPLLKSPSESWLYRTLPSIPSRSLFAPKKQSPKLSSHETKWETIVKSSNLRYDHVRYSEVRFPFSPVEVAIILRTSLLKPRLMIGICIFSLCRNWLLMRHRNRNQNSKVKWPGTVDHVVTSFPFHIRFVCIHGQEEIEIFQTNKCFSGRSIILPLSSKISCPSTRTLLI